MNNRIVVEIIGLLSVIGSLVFVGLEINQNTSAVRGATQQDISYQISEMYKIGVENDKIASIMSRSYQGLKKKRTNRYRISAILVVFDAWLSPC